MKRETSMLAENLRHTHFPYCLQRQEDGRYVITNRSYKPIGFLMHDWADYNNYPVAIHIKGLTPEIAKRLDHRGRDDLESIYLYGDGTNPELGKAERDAYFERLTLLMSLKVVDDAS
jgi:hypothetical protein